MSVARQFSDINLTPDQQHVIELAFSTALRKLDLVDRSDPLCDLVAKTMTQVLTRGVTNALALSEITIREIGLLR
ncbi:hypothetical protein JQ615_34735 [Bradyrhizobium jicamae]|uniref:Uncharacterized protein n=1 Tax=Bradyrhizobium jicamae TaxID=280332 RepID=A0ABS5FUS6_9BRAD|nr:hypothetical protein [Bradyrhizobium jicamae]MBR0800533.1 hypothetical protein [Bradyrhizobium jicamae]MBR0938291.1 hypothetical protein [Bradyrhizobium jicamae]